MAAGLQPVPALAAAPNVSISSSAQWPMPVSTTQEHIVGEVTNAGGTAGLVRIDLALKDASGGAVGSTFTFANARVLGNGERAPFEEDLFPPPAHYDHFVATVSAGPSVSTPAHSFAFALDACPGADPKSPACQSLVPQQDFTGTVRNDTGFTVDNVEAMFTFLDGSQNVVDQRTVPVYNATGGTSLAAAETGAFHVDRLPDAPPWVSMRFIAEPDYPLDVNPTSLAFGNQLVGTTNALEVTLQNSGPRAITMSESLQNLTAAPGEFALGTTCATISPLASCRVTVTFTPQQTGNRTANLVIADDAAGSPQTIPLTGNGIAPKTTLTPNPLPFSPPSIAVGTSSQKTVTLQNDGTAPLLISGIATTGDSFSQTNQCPSSLDPTKNCVITVKFAPKTGGPLNGTLTVTDSSAGSPHGVPLSGTGLGPGVTLNPTSVAFGNQNVATSRTLHVTLTNSGNDDLKIQSIAPPAGFSETDDCPAPTSSLAANGHCTLNVTFAPSQPGSFSGNLLVTDNAGDSPQKLPLSGTGVSQVTFDQPSLTFGSQLVGTTSSPKSVKLTNTGTSPLTISGASTSGDFAQQSADCGALPKTLQPGDSCTFRVTFTPSQPGPANGSLTITDDAAASQTQTVSLSGTGTKSDWESLQGVITSGPDASSWGAGRMDVFVRGTDNALWHRAFNNGSWGDWEALHGVITADPSAVSWGANHIDVFVRGTDSALWHRSFDGTWSNWESLGGRLTSAPDAASGAVGHLDVFVRGTDKALWQITFDGGAWGTWQSLGGVVTADPSAVSSSPGHIDVFVRGTDGGLWHRSFNGTWNDWEGLGGSLTTGPDAAAQGSRLDVFVGGTDHALWHRAFNGTWGGWESFGGVLTADPSAVSQSAGTVDVFVRGTDAALWHRTIPVS